MESRLRFRRPEQWAPFPAAGGRRRLHPRVPGAGGRHLAPRPSRHARARPHHRAATAGRCSSSATIDRQETVDPIREADAAMIRQKADHPSPQALGSGDPSGKAAEGTELTSHAILGWQQERGVAWHYIAPSMVMIGQQADHPSAQQPWSADHGVGRPSITTGTIAQRAPAGAGAGASRCRTASSRA